MWREVVGRCAGGRWARPRCWFGMGGATANSLAASCFGHDRMTRWHRANPGAPRCWRIWISAWGRIELADERTARLNREFKGGLASLANQERFNFVTLPALLHDATGERLHALESRGISRRFPICISFVHGPHPVTYPRIEQVLAERHRIEVASGARCHVVNATDTDSAPDAGLQTTFGHHPPMGRCSSSPGAKPNQPTGTLFGSRSGTRRMPERFRPSRYDERGERASAEQRPLRIKEVATAGRTISLRWMPGKGEEDREEDCFRLA